MPRFKHKSHEVQAFMWTEAGNDLPEVRRVYWKLPDGKEEYKGSLFESANGQVYALKQGYYIVTMPDGIREVYTAEYFRKQFEELYNGAFSELIGKQVEMLCGDSDNLTFYIKGNKPLSFSAEGDCCSSSWFEHISGLDYLLGATVKDVQEISMGEIPEAELVGRDVVQNYGWRFITDKGYFEIEIRNESNGYYGGYVNLSSSIYTKEIKEDF